MEATLVKWMSLEDANSAGFVHGGTVMKLCDEAAGLAAIKYCKRRVVTAGMDRMTFVSPINIRELLTLKAHVNAAWRTSMEVGVRVEAENVLTGEVRHASTAYLTMVALDEEGAPTEVPVLEAGEDPISIRRLHDAQVRRANRLAERAEILRDRA
jgi:acyl-CoA hydrolase